jgi:hypothetical protein
MMTTMTRTTTRRRLRVAAVAASALATTMVGVGPAAANTSPSGCGTPHLINSAAIRTVHGDRVGTLTQYWGWCNGNLRNWAHVHLGSATAWSTKVSIQTPDGVRHGVKVGQYGNDFTSNPTATMNRSTRARVEGTVLGGGQHEVAIKVAVTAYSG